MVLGTNPSKSVHHRDLDSHISKLNWDNDYEGLEFIIHFIFILIKPFGDLSWPMDRGIVILKEVAPII